jgi:hypothetical protein
LSAARRADSLHGEKEKWFAVLHSYMLKRAAKAKQVKRGERDWLWKNGSLYPASKGHRIRNDWRPSSFASMNAAQTGCWKAAG